MGVKVSFSLYLACMSLAEYSGCLPSQSKSDAFLRVWYLLRFCFCLVSVHFGASNFVGFGACATRSPGTFPKESKIVHF